MRGAVVLGGLLMVLAVAGVTIRDNELILAEGRVVRLQLAPVDPRSLLQGDYMALNYEIGNQLRGRRPREDGYVVVRPDTQGIGRLVRVQEQPLPVATDELALRFRVRWAALGLEPRRGGIRFATNAFFFQEGHGKALEGARYGEFRVGANGEPRLVALLDAELRRLGDGRY